MRYKTSDLSKVLNVSANTIRRFAEKGYLCPEVDDANQYRYFGNSDVEKITYISKYRKIGFGHDEIARIFNSDIETNCAFYEKKMQELDDEIKRLQFIRHMVKDDAKMMRGIDSYGDDFIEMNSVAVDYVTYKVEDKIDNCSEKQKVLYDFVYEFPEIEYIYIIRKEDILKRKIRCEEAIAIRTRLAQALDIGMNEKFVEKYPQTPSVLKIVRLPINFTECEGEEREVVKRILFDDFFRYMEVRGYVLDGDAVGVKIGFSKEDGKEMQYVVLGMPVALK